MYIWYISFYEPLPIGGKNNRLMRSGFLAQALYSQGHDVELWLPGFEHVQHRQFRKESSLEQSCFGFKIQYIRSIGYNSDLSIRRFIHNKLLSIELQSLLSKRQRKPDIIISQIPLLELASTATQFAVEENIPIIIDIRDPWPDVYRRMFGSKSIFLYHMLFFREKAMARYILKNASSITAVSQQYLLWSTKYSRREIRDLDKVFHIGVNSSVLEIENQKRVDFSILKNKFVCVYVGTLGYNFDLDLIVSAAKKIDKAGIENILIVVAGSGEGEDLLNQASKHIKTLEYFGWLDFPEVKELYSYCSLGLAPFPSGAMNTLTNKVFEYLSFSLPILTSVGGELESILGANDIGRRYISGNIDDFLDKIDYYFDLYEQGEIDKIKTRSYSVFKNNFDSRLIYESFAKHVEQIFDTKRGIKK